MNQDVMQVEHSVPPFVEYMGAREDLTLSSILLNGGTHDTIWAGRQGRHHLRAQTGGPVITSLA